MRRCAPALAAAVVASAFACAAAQSNAALEALIAAREAEVVAIAQRSEALLGGTAPCDTADRTCATCSYNSCAQAPGDATCQSDFGTPGTCGGDSGQLLSKDTSGIKLAPDVITTADGATKRNPHSDICATHELDTTFSTQLAAAQTSGEGLAWQYLGTRHGVYRFFPGNVWGASGSTCSEYDPRKRPWYVAAASGAKRVVLVLDRSGSMGVGTGSNTRINIAKEAAQSVLGTLTSADLFGIVLFSSDPLSYASQLRPATASNVEAANAWLETNVVAGGRTFPDTAFTAAFDILQASADAEVGTTACRSVILFMSDGDPSDTSGADAQTVLAARTATGAGQGTFIFTYSLGQDAERAFPKAIACAHRGVWARITNTQDLISAMAGYYEFIAAGLERDSVVWTESYVDALGLGLVTTAAFPVYDRAATPPLLLGVAGVDVQMADFLGTGASAEGTLEVLVERSRTCGNFTAGYCTLERLRGAETCDATRFAADCPADADSAAGTPTCSTAASGSPWCHAASAAYSGSSAYADATCCPSEDAAPAIGAIVGGVVGAVVGLAVLAFIVYRCTRPKAPNVPNDSATARPPAHGAPAPQAAPHAHPAPVVPQYAAHGAAPPGHMAGMSYYAAGPGVQGGAPAMHGTAPPPQYGGQYPAAGQHSTYA